MGVTDEGAQKQALGLMNKGVIIDNKAPRVAEEGENFGNPENFDPNSILSNTKKAKNVGAIKEPPVEDQLMTQTLWPESQKLYGHAFEIFCIASSHKGDCAASSCKAKQEMYADIIIWQIIQNNLDSDGP